jgi:uncharacterized lipoprotein YddW (UPF0748 family)
MRSNRFARPLPFLLLASTLLISSCGRQVFTGKHEARGLWMSRFEYAGGERQNKPDAVKAYIRETFEKARAARMNMVFFQVRGNGDVLYPSSVEPWSTVLTGTLGKDPGWDPLAFAVGEAQRLGLELHAWLNTFPVWRDSVSPPATVPPNPLYAHPEWLICDRDGRPMRLDPPNNNYLWASPGNPAVREHILNVVAEVLQKYDVDGIHFDYIRYPEGTEEQGYSHDAVSVARFNDPASNPGRLSWEHWQREQVNQFVFDAYHLVQTRKPWVKMSASVIGEYTGTGWTAYEAVLQDPRRWMEVGKIDFVVPMVYWERAHATKPFIPLITEWHDRVAYDRHVLPGLATRLIERLGWGELEAQVEAVRATGLPGVVFYSAAGLQRVWDMVGERSFPYWALTPPMPWKPGLTPEAPQEVSISTVSGEPTLSWNAVGGNGISYIVYRSAETAFNTSDVFAIVSVTGRAVTSISLRGVEPGSVLAVAAVDRLGAESRLSSPVRYTGPTASR